MADAGAPYDFPTERDWRRGWMRSAPLDAPGSRGVYAAWNFIHPVEECRWSDCELHHPVVNAWLQQFLRGAA